MQNSFSGLKSVPSIASKYARKQNQQNARISFDVGNRAQTLDWQSSVQPFEKNNDTQNRNGAVNLFDQKLQNQQEQIRLENEQKPQSEQVARLMHQIQVNRAIQQLALMQTEKLQQTQM